MSRQIKIDINTDLVLENQYFIQEIRRLNDDYFYTFKQRKKFHVVTYGCQMNEHDSEKMIAMLVNMGYEETGNYEESDMLIFNTCAVRENAELRVYGNLGHVKNIKKKNPDMIVAVSGCMMQQPHIVEEINKKFKFVDIVFGTHNVHNLPKLMKSVFEDRKQVIEVWDSEGKIIEGLPFERKIGIKAFVNIMFGCNNFCTYCIVPYTRGRERSREKDNIIQEIKLLAEDGVKEVTLLGQNVNSYGKTLAYQYDFSDLLNDVSQVEGLERIRFMTSHPKDISDKLIDVIYKNPKVCEYVHFPIQSGSNQLLKNMNRKYTVEDYYLIVEKLREKMPRVGLSTDIIIGFPGETDSDVDQTIELLKKVQFDSAFTFIYSKREGTPAAKFENHIDEKIKHVRFERMLKILNEKVIEKNQSRMGETFELLVEGYTKRDDQLLYGRSRENILVSFKGDESLIGKIVNVKVTRPKNFSVEGELVDTSM